MSEELWEGKCLDCNYKVTGDKRTVLSEAVGHELRYPGHWVEQGPKV